MNILISAELLQEMIEYVESAEQGYDAEHGLVRKIPQVSPDDMMPDLYATLKTLEARQHPNRTEDNRGNK